ncbi:MAG: hypothetical protein LBR75_00420 [Prevotellaceae bacterium]|jgi:hypothetical protein|nr:hypothetical protein [Prevotellaceae bacterium]
MKKIIFTALAVSLCVSFTMAQNNKTQQSRRSDRKIIELTKIVKINPHQEEILRLAYERNAKEGDSILFQVQDPVEAAYLKRSSNKTLHETLMKTLNEKQRNEYIRVTSTPEVMEKAASRVAELAETDDYTEAQLEEAQKEIFNYLMLEKVVYARDKFDHRKQKENIRKLKGVEPTHLKKANAREKMRTQGKSVQGKVKW